MTLEETLKLEDDDETGFVTYDQLIGVFSDIDCELDAEMSDFVGYLVYKNSDSTQQMYYPVSKSN